MHYGSGAAVITGVAGGALPFTGLNLAWIAFLAIFLIVLGSAMLRIARIPSSRG